MRKEDQAAPFLAAVRQKLSSGGQAFHTPGHKGGRMGDPELRACLKEALLLDTDPPALPLPGGAGSAAPWAAPSEVIRAAEDLLARLYGARRSFFLVNGSTGGIQALLLATVAGGSLLLPRQVHRSVLGALALADAHPVYLPGELDPFWGLPHAPHLPAPPRFPAVQAVLATYPDYYGLAVDLSGWRAALAAGARSALASRKGSAGGPVPLLVDEAHGAHLPFLPRPVGADGPVAPRPALDLGADAAVQSPHKLLGSLVQSAWLHLAPERPAGPPAVDAARVEAALATLTTTSPSFLLLSSLDATRRWAAVEGAEVWAQLACLTEEARRRIGSLPGLRCLDHQEAVRLGYPALDPTKLTVSVRGLGLLGPEAEAYLRWQGIQVELADPFNVLLVLTPADPPETVDRLASAFASLVQASSRPADRARLTAERPAGATGPEGVAGLLQAVFALSPERGASPRQALLGSSEAVPLEQAAGRVSARAVGVYPPGIPLLAPGEVVADVHVELLCQLSAAGLRVEGLASAQTSPGRALEVCRP